jgi:uncharacterized membrane protein SpoIIM required for sporulation
MFWALALAALYILGLWWCYEVIRRFPQDVQEIRELKETARKAAIVFVWAITVPIAVVVTVYGFVLIDRLTSFVRELL